MIELQWRVDLIRLFFFFQAEDGIRDIGVTGVQTCALPICVAGLVRIDDTDAGSDERYGGTGDRTHGRGRRVNRERSEERRVGKECRSRWLADDLKKKQTQERENGSACTMMRNRCRSRVCYR